MIKVRRSNQTKQRFIARIEQEVYGQMQRLGIKTSRSAFKLKRLCTLPVSPESLLDQKPAKKTEIESVTAT